MDRDLSLIEIGCEDDSLLHQITADDVSGCSNKSYFSISPLQGPRSFVPQLGEYRKVNKEGATSCSSVLGNCANKENTNINKQEVSKFSVDPYKMKRKKKGAGYNLRKSLAWDKAFSTEEGVLDPVELSVISGNYNNIGGVKLSVIHEEGRESLSGAMEDARNSADLQGLEESLFKDLPSTDATEERQAGATLSQKNYSPSRNKAGSSTAFSSSQVKQKVLSTNGVNRGGSKRSSCPRPLTSLKRPPTMTVEKTASKELKVSKMPVPKSVPGALSTTFRNSKTERNQIARPVISVQKNVGTKIPTTNARSARNETKSENSSAANPCTQHARKNVVNFKSETHSSMNSHPQRAAKEKNFSQRGTGAGLPASTQASNVCGGGDINVGISLPRKFSNIGGKVPCTQTQTTKPSGLRMPSPSFGFFGQSEAPASLGLLRSGLCSLPKSNIPKVANDGPLKPICERLLSTPVILTEVAQDVTARIAAAQCTSEGQFAPSSVNDASREKIESKLQPSNNQQSEDWKSPLIQGPYKQVTKEDEDKTIAEACEDFYGVPNANNQHGGLNESLKHSIYEAQSISYEKHPSMQINTDFLSQESISSTEFKKGDCENRADASLEVQVSIESELEMCHGPSRKEGAAGVDSGNSDAHLYSHGGSVLVESGNNILKSLDVDNTRLMVVDQNRQYDQSKLPSFSCEESCLENIMVPEKSDASGSELKSSPCLIPSAVTDCGSNTKDMVKCLHDEDKLSSPLISDPAVENFNSASPQSLDVELHKIEDLKRMDKVEREDAISNRVVSRSELDKQHLTPNFGPSVVLAEVGALEISDAISHEFVEGKHHNISMRNHHDVYDLQSRDDSSHNQLSTSMDHDDWSSSTTDRIDLLLKQAKVINSWSYEDDKASNNENRWKGSCEGFMSDKDRLSVESPKIKRGNTTDASPEAKCSNETGFEGAGYLPHHINTEKEAAESRSFAGSPSSDSCRDSPSAFKCRVIINDVSEQREYPRLPDPNLNAEQISPSHSALHSDEKFFLADKFSTQELPERNELRVVSDAVSGPSDSCGKLRSSDFYAKVVPTILDCSVDVDDKADHPYKDDAMLVSTENELKGGSTLRGVDLFSKVRGEEILEAVGTCPKPVCCSSEYLVSSAEANRTQLSGSILQDIEVTLSESRISPQEADTSVVKKRCSYEECQPHHDLGDSSCSAEKDDVTVMLKKSDDEKKAGVLPMKPPPEATPFSDEWLAAFEAAGEEILTAKSGAVQNSPPDKPLPKPGPWSPVRKNLEVGPFDCTKYTNTNVSLHSPS